MIGWRFGGRKQQLLRFACALLLVIDKRPYSRIARQTPSIAIMTARSVIPR
jgi:hypothetical protein